jgi:hypothetical protein
MYFLSNANMHSLIELQQLSESLNSHFIRDSDGRPSEHKPCTIVVVLCFRGENSRLSTLDSNTDYICVICTMTMCVRFIEHPVSTSHIFQTRIHLLNVICSKTFSPFNIALILILTCSHTVQLNNKH